LALSRPVLVICELDLARPVDSTFDLDKAEYVGIVHKLSLNYPIADFF
jgi:hypothetical protein